MSQEEQEKQKKIEFKNSFGHKFFLDPNFFPTKNFSNLNFFLTQNNFWINFFQTQNDVCREKTKLLKFKLSKLA